MTIKILKFFSSFIFGYIFLFGLIILSTTEGESESFAVYIFGIIGLVILTLVFLLMIYKMIKDRESFSSTVEVFSNNFEDLVSQDKKVLLKSKKSKIIFPSYIITFLFIFAFLYLEINNFLLFEIIKSLLVNIGLLSVNNFASLMFVYVLLLVFIAFSILLANFILLSLFLFNFKNKFQNFCLKFIKSAPFVLLFSLILVLVIFNSSKDRDKKINNFRSSNRKILSYVSLTFIKYYIYINIASIVVGKESRYIKLTKGLEILKNEKTKIFNIWSTSGISIVFLWVFSFSALLINERFNLINQNITLGFLLLSTLLYIFWRTLSDQISILLFYKNYINEK